MTAGQLALADAKPIAGKGGARHGAGRKTDAERASNHFERYNEARAKREVHNAQIAEYEARKLAGELVEVAQVGVVWQKENANMRAKLLSVPVKTAPLLIGLTSIAEIEAVLTDAIHEALRELSGDGGA